MCYHSGPEWTIGAMAMKGHLAFPKAPALLKSHHQLFSVINRTLVGGGGSYPSAEVQSVYSTAASDWATYILSKTTYEKILKLGSYFF